MDNYTIDTMCRNVIEIKKSQFIATVFYVDSEELAKKYIDEFSKKDAKHNCFAFILLKDNQVIKKCSDDGEPKGTAGVPILSVLENKRMQNVLILVTRYFGGIKLGASNLLLQYKNSAIEVLNKATIKIIDKAVKIEMIYDFTFEKQINYVLKVYDYGLVDVEYSSNIKKTFCFRESDFPLINKQILTIDDSIKMFVKDSLYWKFEIKE